MFPPAILNDETGPHEPVMLRRQVTKPCPKRPPKPNAPFLSDGTTATQRAWSSMPFGIPLSGVSIISCSTWPERSKRSVTLEETPALAGVQNARATAAAAMLMERNFIGNSPVGAGIEW